MYRFKQFAKSMILSTFLFVFCCQNDDNANNHYQSHTTLASDDAKQLITVKAETIPHILDFIAHEQKGFLPQLEPHTRHLDTNNPFGIIDTSIIKALEDLQGNRVYTFKIIPFTPSNGIFHNLIVVTDYDANIIKSYIKSYESFENKKIGVDFNGKVSKHNLDGTLVNDIVFYQGKANGPDCTPCEDVTDDTDTNNHGGSTSGDSDDTTNDPTDTDTDSTSGTSGGGGSSSASSGPGSTSSSASNASNSGTGGENISITIIPCPCEGHSLEEPCTCHTPPTIIIDIGAALNHKNAASAIPLPCCEEDVAVIEEEDTPCQKLNTLLNDSNFANALSDIQQGADGDSERGYEISKDDNGNISTNFVQGGFDETDLATGGDIIGGIHNHTEDNGHPIFSGQDISMMQFYYLHNQNRPPNGNLVPGDIASVVVGQNGTYAMTINNYFTLTNLLNTIGVRKLTRKLNNAYDRNTGWQGPSKYTKALLKTINKLLSKHNIQGTPPISLYKLNQDGTAFEEITLDENNEPNAPQACN